MGVKSYVPWKSVKPPVSPRMFEDLPKFGKGDEEIEASTELFAKNAMLLIDTAGCNDAISYIEGQDGDQRLKANPEKQRLLLLMQSV